MIEMLRLTVRRLYGRNKLIGLVFAKYPYPVLLKTRFGIHTFGMKFRIDVLILDKDNNVVRMQQVMAPNKIYLWPFKYNRVVELPEGEIKRKRIKLGQKVNLNIK